MIQVSKNYIEDRNPFKLTKPPAWFLMRLYDFDPDLVIIPSREQPYHWLARRWRLLAGFSGKPMDSFGPSGDVQMMITHRLVDVYTLAKLTSEWTELNLAEMIQHLKDSDTWAEEGEKPDDNWLKKALSAGESRVTKRVDYEEKVSRERKQAVQRETVWHATGDAYRSLQARLGRRIRNPGLPKPAQPPAETHAGA